MRIPFPVRPRRRWRPPVGETRCSTCAAAATTRGLTAISAHVMGCNVDTRLVRGEAVLKRTSISLRRTHEHTRTRTHTHAEGLHTKYEVALLDQEHEDGYAYPHGHTHVHTRTRTRTYTHTRTHLKGLDVECEVVLLRDLQHEGGAALCERRHVVHHQSALRRHGERARGEVGLLRQAHPGLKHGAF